MVIPKLSYISLLIIGVEILFCGIIIYKVPYTEIDWIAYMEEVRHFINGEKDYFKIYGNTGPLVYPAGFLYVFSFLFFITDDGENITRGQIIFAVVYIMVLIATLMVYRTGIISGAKIPIWALLALIFSKRIHSLFVLRMFNDCIAILFAYIAITFLSNNKIRLGCIWYSLAVSIKMNILLFAPGLLLILLISSGVTETITCIFICAVIQAILGSPFLITHPIAYISRSFELNRVFLYKWTVNWKFLPEDLFVSKFVSILLLGLTIAALGLFARKIVNENVDVVLRRRGKAAKILGISGPAALLGPTPIKKPLLTSYTEMTFLNTLCSVGLGSLSPHFIIYALFTSNFIGIVFARTLHYQFYTWYFFSLPYLLWSIFPASSLLIPLRILLLIVIEVCFNVYPATWWSSLSLQACHVGILLGLYLSPAPLALQEAPETKKFKNRIGKPVDNHEEWKKNI